MLSILTALAVVGLVAALWFATLTEATSEMED